MIENAVNALGDAVDPWGYLLLFTLCLLEASAFVGLFIPGETALLIAGVLAQEGKLTLALCIVCAVARRNSRRLARLRDRTSRRTSTPLVVVRPQGR